MDCLRQLQSVGLHQGLLPLIDLIFEEDGGEQFVELALARTDARVRAGKTISPSFMFAALLWKLVNKRWQEICASRSEEHTSELQSLMRISYAVFCLKNNK